MLQIGFAAAIKTGLIKLEDSTNFASKLSCFRKQLEVYPEDAIVALALGSSRIMNGINTGGFAERLAERTGRPALVYNFGVTGSGNIYSFLSLEKIIDEGIRPDLVFVEIYPGFLVPNSETKWFTANELRSKNFQDTQRYGIEPVSRPWYREWLAAWHTYRFDILNYISPKMLPMRLRENWAVAADDFGWVAVDRGLDQQLSEKQIKRFAQISDPYDLRGHSCQALRDTLALCNELGIQCVLIWMPEPEGIRDNYRPEIVPRVEAFLVDLREEFEFQTIMSWDWVQDDGFYDSAHLNRRGAEDFTRKLAQRITAPNANSVASRLTAEDMPAR
jgi:hypothetical protein